MHLTRQVIRTRCGLLFGASIWLSTRTSHAENPDRFYMSGEAALQAGAITADITDGASTWYNPAGLARMKGTRFDINASAYALRLGGSPAIDVESEGSEKSNLSVLEFSPAPAAMALSKRFRTFTAGFGIFVPKMEVSGLRTQVKQGPEDERLGLDLSIDYHEVTQSLYGGPAFGVRLAPGVDFGMAFFLNYRSVLATGDVTLYQSNAQGEGILLTQHQLIDWLEFGVLSQMGVQLQLSERLRLGMTLRLPSLRVFQIRDESNITSVGAKTITEVDGSEVTEANLGSEAEFRDTTNVPLRFIYPPRFHLGVSYSGARGRLAVELNYQTPFRNRETGENFRPLGNVRLGYQHRLESGRTLGGGFFTNLAADRKPQTLGQRQLNYFGLTIATQSGSIYEVSAKDGHTLEAPRHLTFGSNFAFTYALGLGRVVHGSLNDDGGGPFITMVPYGVVAHEWILSVGSSIME